MYSHITIDVNALNKTPENGIYQGVIIYLENDNTSKENDAAANDSYSFMIYTVPMPQALELEADAVQY